MRCTRIEFKGFRRLANASTNIDGDITAFVGFNEAGKTSILEGLEWFSKGGPLGTLNPNRSRPPAGDDAEVVKVYFELDQSDREAIAHVRCDNPPTSMTLSRKANNARVYRLKPSPTRPAKPFTDARDRLEQALKSLASQFNDAVDDEYEDPNDWAMAVSVALERANTEWSEAELKSINNLAAWLEEVPTGRKTARDTVLARMLREVESLAEDEDPSSQIWEILSERMPSFVMFRDENREIQTTYDLSTQATSLPPAVVDLLRIANVDPVQLLTHIQQGDVTKRETLLERGNEALRELFGAAWNQSGITVRLNVYAHHLEILVRELGPDGAVTQIAERSDGLKAFVALVAFLAAGKHNVPPILLIDEAETHLHYDAQADLVGVLLKSIDATQVFYSTHSPGCLPSDLGTGIRVVAREPGHADASIIKNNFWQGEGPGFSPLLFAMGAGAAAFSACRRAVLAEGAADMVLLPSLIRMATGLPDLDYQVAQGLANAHGSDLRVEEVAARVTYLVDGDGGGADHARELRAAGVHKSRIFSLPDGCAAEDLIERDDYIHVVNELLETMGQKKRFAVTDCVEGQPIASTFEKWARSNKVQFPSKVEVAYSLLRYSGLRLTTKGKRALVKLHEGLDAAFAARAHT